VTLQVRDAGVQDGAACAQIYAPYVRDTAITFEAEPPSAEEMAHRIAAAHVKHEWLILEDDTGAVIGYAYGTEFKSRAAYQWSVETSVYLAADRHRGGGGRLLYTELLARLARRGYRRAFAGITQPNEASMAFHRAFGFQEAGVFRRVGFKHGSWRDVAWLQADLREPEADRDSPEPVS
jgi:phosphinothricin acetyltransferase